MQEYTTRAVWQFRRIMWKAAIGVLEGAVGHKYRTMFGLRISSGERNNETTPAAVHVLRSQSILSVAEDHWQKSRRDSKRAL
jgi:hypothetical protein